MHRPSLTHSRTRSAVTGPEALVCRHCLFLSIPSFTQVPPGVGSGPPPSLNPVDWFAASVGTPPVLEENTSPFRSHSQTPKSKGSFLEGRRGRAGGWRGLGGLQCCHQCRPLGLGVQTELRRAEWVRPFEGQSWDETARSACISPPSESRIQEPQGHSVQTCGERVGSRQVTRTEGDTHVSSGQRQVRGG